MSKLTDQQRLDLVRLYQDPAQKHNCATLARLYHLDNSSVRGILQRRGVPLKPSSVTSRRYDLDQTFFDVIDTEEKAYFLGLLYADGYNNTDRGEIHLSLQIEDSAILERFKTALKSTRPLMTINLSQRGRRNQKDVCRLDVSSIRMSNRLSELGCMKAKSLILTFPDSSQLPDHLHRHFIRGYFDGDGSFTVSMIRAPYRQYSVCIVSTDSFCRSIQSILSQKVDISTYFSKRHKDRDDTNRNVHVSGNKQVMKFLNWLYEDATVYLARKHTKYLCELEYLSLKAP